MQNDKAYALVSGVIFAFVALAHLYRLIALWPLVVAGWPVPLWVNGIGLVAAGTLAVWGLGIGFRRA